MLRKMVLTCVGSALLLAQPARAVWVRLRGGGELRGDVLRVTFRQIDGTSRRFARDEVVSIQLADGKLPKDEIELKGGKKLKGLVVAIRFKSIAGEMPLERARLAVLVLSRAYERQAAPPLEPRKAVPKYDDAIELSYGCKVRAVVLAAEVRVDGKCVRYARHAVSAIKLAAKGDTIVLPDAKEVKCALESIQVKAGYGWADFDRKEIRSMELGMRLPTASARKAWLAKPAPTVEGGRAMVLNNDLHTQYFRQVAQKKSEALGQIGKKFAGPLGSIEKKVAALEQKVRSKKEEARDHRKEWRRWRDRNDRLDRERRDDHWSRDRDRVDRRAEERARREAERAFREYREAQRDLDKVLPDRDRLRGQKGRESRAVHDWAKRQTRRLSDLRLKHEFILLSRGQLSEDQIANRYQRAFEGDAVPEGKPLPKLRTK